MAIDAIKTHLHCPVDLAYLPLEPISLPFDGMKSDEDVNEETFTVISSVCEKNSFKIKMELKEEEDYVDNDEICGDGNNNILRLYMELKLLIVSLKKNVV